MVAGNVNLRVRSGIRPELMRGADYPDNAVVDVLAVLARENDLFANRVLTGPVCATKGVIHEDYVRVFLCDVPRRKIPTFEQTKTQGANVLLSYARPVGHFQVIRVVWDAWKFVRLLADASHRQRGCDAGGLNAGQLLDTR